MKFTIDEYENASTNDERVLQFNIPFGHRYGFCFLPYPSYLPGEGTNSEWSRCIPKFPSNDNPNATGAFQVFFGILCIRMPCKFCLCAHVCMKR